MTFGELAGGARGKLMAVTFDDAFASVRDLARPLLDRLGVPATVFVPSAFPATPERPMAWDGTDRWLGGPHERELLPMSWDDLAELADSGWEVGSHTRTHPRLTRLGDAELREELAGSRRDCEERLGRPCPTLAYPYGDHDARVVEAARAAGYGAACTLPARLHPPAPLRWPRVGVYHGDDLRRFRLKVSRPLRTLRASPLWPRR